MYSVLGYLAWGLWLGALLVGWHLWFRKRVPLCAFTWSALRWHFAQSPVGRRFVVVLLGLMPAGTLIATQMGLMERIYGVCVAMLATTILLLFLYTQCRHAHRRFAAFIRDCSYLVCLECFYPLHHCGDATVCPECGSPYVPKVVSERWKQLLSEATAAS